MSTGRSIHAVPSITPSPREGIEDGPRLRDQMTPGEGQRRIGVAAVGKAAIKARPRAASSGHVVGGGRDALVDAHARRSAASPSRFSPSLI